MHQVRTASFALDLALVVILFVVVAFAAAYRPEPTPADNYRQDVIIQEDDHATGGHGPR